MKYGKKKFIGVLLWELYVFCNIKVGEINRMREGNDKEIFLVKVIRNIVCFCYVIVVDGGRLGKSGKGSNIIV